MLKQSFKSINLNFFCIFAVMVKVYKNIIAYNLTILVLLAYNYKTINHYIKLTDSSINFYQDFDCEEKDPTSKKMEDKNDKKDFSEYLPINKAHSFLIINQLSFAQRAKTLYASSDYSMAVYSPPDAAII